MKFKFIGLLLFIFSFLHAQEPQSVRQSKSQEELITLIANDEKLTDILTKLDAITKTNFSFNPDIIPDIRITNNFKDLKVDEILSILLKNTNLTFSYFSNHIIFSEKNATQNQNEINQISTIVKKEPKTSQKTPYQPQEDPEKIKPKLSVYDTMTFVVYVLDTIKVIDSITITNTETIFIYDTLKSVKKYQYKKEGLSDKNYKWGLYFEGTYSVFKAKITPNSIDQQPVTDSITSAFTLSDGMGFGLGFSRYFDKMYLKAGLGYFNLIQEYKYANTHGDILKSNNISRYFSSNFSLGYLVHINNFGLNINTGIHSGLLLNANNANVISKILTPEKQVELNPILVQFFISGGLLYNLSPTMAIGLNTGYSESLNSLYKTNRYDFVLRSIDFSVGIKNMF